MPNKDKQDARERTFKVYGKDIDILRSLFEKQYFSKDVTNLEKKVIARMLAKLQ